MTDRTIDARNASKILDPDLLAAFHDATGLPQDDASEESIWVLFAKDGIVKRRQEYDFCPTGLGSMLKDLHDWLEKGEGYSAAQAVEKQAPESFRLGPLQVSASSR